jgi:hypothetical protein
MGDDIGVPDDFTDDVGGAVIASSMPLVRMADAGAGRQDADQVVEEIMSPGALELREAHQASLDRAAHTGSKLTPPRLTEMSTSLVGAKSPPLVHNGLLGVAEGTVDRPGTPMGTPRGSSPPPYNPMKSPPPPARAASPPLDNLILRPASPQLTCLRTQTSKAANAQGLPATQPIASSSRVPGIEPPSASQPVSSRPRQVYRPAATSELGFIKKNGKKVRTGCPPKRKRLDGGEPEVE